MPLASNTATMRAAVRRPTAERRDAFEARHRREHVPVRHGRAELRGRRPIIDIGGQDMKCFKIRNGAVDSIMLNEACSSGCGSFIETFAKALGYNIADFSKLGLFAAAPVNLGSRCTVFMNSSVKQAQKDGASVEAISAGLSISIVKNAIYKVIRAANADSLGKNIVVQGGTFLNDAVLRSFELELGRNVIRPVIAGLMGAFGAALAARMHYDDIADDTDGDTDAAGVHVACIDGVDPHRLEHPARHRPRRAVDDDRTRRVQTVPEPLQAHHHHIPRRIALCDRQPVRTRRRRQTQTQRPAQPVRFQIQACLRLPPSDRQKATRGEIGIPRVLNMYENYPFWFTLLTSLGFKVVISGRSNHELFETGIESIASENICYPAKLVHGTSSGSSTKASARSSTHASRSKTTWCQNPTTTTTARSWRTTRWSLKPTCPNCAQTAYGSCAPTSTSPSTASWSTASSRNSHGPA
jgi:hypothetical protein